MFDHGGALYTAAKEYDIAVSRWLDVSTGINPWAWKVSTVAQKYWQNLPQEEDGLYSIANRYYGSKYALAVAGSQMAIRWLPRLRPRGQVGVPHIGYKEHAISWQAAGHQIHYLQETQIDAAIDNLDVLVIINPNNPTGETWSRDRLMHWHERLSRRKAWLIVDEAFIDAKPSQSLAAQSHLDGLIVLRSFGKFFGLAGMRLGFVLANAELCATLESVIGPWSVSTAARWIASQALADESWQIKMRMKLQKYSMQLSELMTSMDLAPTGGTCLFQWVKTPRAQNVHRRLAEQAVFTRFFSEPQSIRIGLPPQTQWPRLKQALSQIQVAKA